MRLVREPDAVILHVRFDEEDRIGATKRKMAEKDQRQVLLCRQVGFAHAAKIPVLVPTAQRCWCCITGLSIIIYATAYMNAVHPPASGIIALFVVMAITPVSGLCLVTAMVGRFAYEGRKRALYYLLLGINFLHIVVFAQIWFHKAVLNKAI